MKKKPGHFSLYYFISSLFFLFSFCPTFLAEKLAGFLGMLWFIADRRHRRLAVENLTNAFSEDLSEAEIRDIAKRNFKHTLMIVFEMARAYKWKSEQLPEYFKIRGMEYFQAAHAKGKGVLLLSGHVGNWEMSVHLKNLTGIDGCGVYRRLDASAFDRFVLEKRRTGGCRLYPVKDAVMGLFHELGQGNFTGILCDQNTRRSQGVFVDFFGRKACTNKGLAQFALATKAPVIPFFILREKGRFVLEFGEEIPLADSGSMETDLIVNTRNYTEAIEDVVRRYPEQWLWVHNRWKTQPLRN